MKLQREPIDGLWEEAAQMLADGFARFDPFPDVPLDPDRGLYQNMEILGFVRVYTARDTCGTLLAYACFLVGPSLRRQGERQAQQDVVHSSNPAVTAWLLRYAERALRDEGVSLIYHSAPTGSRFDQLLAILGYTEVGVNRVKRFT